MIEKCIFISPKLCGCEIELTANWADTPILKDGRKVSYQHPIPRTISSIEIVNVCSGHQSVLTEPLEENYYHYTDEERNNIIEHFDLPEEASWNMLNSVGPKGYLHLQNLDLAGPAEKLYIYHYRYSGATLNPDTCKCKIQRVRDRFTGQMFDVNHDVHTRRCKAHKIDIDNSRCLAENILKNDAMRISANEIDEVVKIENGKRVLDESKISWSFDENRKLRIHFPQNDKTVKDRAKSLLDLHFGTGLIEII